MASLPLVMDIRNCSQLQKPSTVKTSLPSTRRSGSSSLASAVCSLAPRWLDADTADIVTNQFAFAGMQAGADL
jgi:hypothetical protein